jgi:hypothetical protein
MGVVLDDEICISDAQEQVGDAGGVQPLRNAFYIHFRQSQRCPLGVVAVGQAALITVIAAPVPHQHHPGFWG